MANFEAAERGTGADGVASHGSPLKKLYVQVLIAIALGIVLGYFIRA